MALDGTNAAAPAATPAADAGTPAATPAWYESLPADILNDDIKAFKGPDELAKAYIDTKGKVPVVPDKYEFAFPKELDPKEIEAFQLKAKEIGLTQAQYESLAKAEIATVQAATEAAIAQKTEAVATLRKEWGANTDARIQQAETIARQLFGEAYLSAVDIKQAPAILRGLYHLSTKLGEDTLKLGGGPTTGPQIGPDGNPILAYPNTPSMHK